MNPSRKVVLVTGATGYIGGRLAPRLLADGHAVRVLVRSPDKLRDVPWAADVDIVEGDLSDPDSTEAALAGVQVLYYLVHSMGAGKGFEEREKSAAELVVAAAARAGVQRIVYLGGLHPANVDLSTHMRSRAAVGKILLDSPVDAIVFQAGVVIGSGSASFEMIRHLAEVLPFMPAPRWVRNRIEPIAIRDVLHYLAGAAALPPNINRAFDIGSGDVLTYAQMMNVYAEAAGLPHRLILALPIPAPRLAGLWINLVTPIPHTMAVPLVQSLQHDAVTAERDIEALLPAPPGGLTSYRDAVNLALGKMRSGEVETTWASASGTGASADPLPSDPDWAGYKVFTDERTRDCEVDAAYLWRVIEGIGGRNGWYSLPAAWSVRGWIDKFTGGVGHRRGRRHPDRLQTGDALDFWRVEQINRGQSLRLRAEMRLPGRAWLELAADSHGAGSTYRQRAIFFPRGLSGRLYWLAVLPFHGIIFQAMSRNITRAAAALAASGTAGAADRHSGAAG